MKLVRISDLAGKPVFGLRADIRSRNPDGTLKHPDLDDHQHGPIMVTLKSVEIEQAGYCCGSKSKRPGEEGLFPWLYWRWDGYSCGYSGHRIDNGHMPDDHIEIEESEVA